ncbi:hypothetical protein QYE76_013545 [Lolium multiflorum]|uniref:Retrotransposon gag domain-containing protein n=1 Tax=Lolium multiflorum TaxID=4521 RepID=A0AAD8U2U3_LOLMU|nr:hypothetical protein QYE76_013545 [Lolium multiflorum]
MEGLSPESRALYEILKADTQEEYEERFLAHKKEILDVMRGFVVDTTKQIRAVSTSVESVRVAMGDELTEARNSIGTELEAFTGAAATWLESFLVQFPQAGWQEFVQGVMARFMRNQQQVLLRCLYHISQTTTVEDYVQRFSDLVDQLQAHGTQSDPLHYLTKFLDGLFPAVRVLVAIQQPQDLDTAYTLALLYEELGDVCIPLQSQSPFGAAPRRAQSIVQPALPPPPPAKWVSKSVEERK